MINNKNIKSSKQSNDNTYIHWFMENLGYGEREKIRKYYFLDDPTLKITNEILKSIYKRIK